jgi:hypothetical protein
VKRKHPIQPVALDEDGVPRFVKNRIVRFLLDQYEPGLNDLANRFCNSKDEDLNRSDLADWEQLLMLIGYTISGFGSHDIDRRTIAIVDRKTEALLARRDPES